MNSPAVNNDVLLYWRKRIYEALLKAVVILGGIAYIPSMILSVTEEIWSVAVLDTCVYALALGIFFMKNIPFYTRVFLLNFILYILSICLLIFLGSMGAGWLWLFAFPVITTILSGFRLGIYAIIINTFTLLALGVLLQQNYLGAYLIHNYEWQTWMIISINFICLNIMVCIPIAVLVRGLEASILQDKESQALLLIQQNELHKHNQELIKINEDMDNFVYAASHDLKSPLTNIEGLVTYLSMSLEEDKKEEAQTILPLIHKSVHKFKKILADLAEIGKAQKDISESTTESVVIKELFDEIVSNLNPALKKRAFIIDTNFEIPSMRFSRKNLRSVLYNLMSNALKYSSAERSPEILVSIRRKDDVILLSVKDNGIGMPKGYENNIFKMFKRIHDHVEGSGVGLYLVKKIVDNNKGKIEVETIQGKGTTFNLFLYEENL